MQQLLGFPAEYRYTLLNRNVEISFVVMSPEFSAAPTGVELSNGNVEGNSRFPNVVLVYRRPPIGLPFASTNKCPKGVRDLHMPRGFHARAANKCDTHYPNPLLPSGEFDPKTAFASSGRRIVRIPMGSCTIRIPASSIPHRTFRHL